MSISRREKKRRKRKRLFVMFMFLILLIGFIFLMNIKRFLVSSIEIEGNKTILSNDIESSIGNVINRKIFFIPMNNLLFLNAKRIEKVVKNDFPKIYEAHVSIKDGSTLTIKIGEREPHSLWCKYDNGIDENDNSLLDFNEECFFADQRGFIYTKAPYFSSGVFDKIYIDGDELKIGEQILDGKEFDNFFKFINVLESEFGVTIDHVLITKYNETEIFINSLLRKKLINKPYIVYHTNDDYGVIERNMKLMINHELFKKDFSSNPKKLKYIDLRITDQIRYKFMTDEEYIHLTKEGDKTKKEDE